MGGLIMATALGALASFMICGIPFGMLFAARMSGVDVRHSGSGNIGMTNVARTAGGKAAALTFACDVGKGLICMLVGKYIICTVCVGGDWAAIGHDGAFGWVGTSLYCACVLGHIFSPYLHFHGGKGISVGLGAGLGMYWPIALGMLAVFLLLVIPTRYVSLGSVAAAISLPIQGVLWRMSLQTLIPLVIISVAVVWAHRENIGRLVRGEEHRFSLGKGGKR